MCHNLAAFGNLKALRKDLIKDVLISTRFNNDGFALYANTMPEPLRTLDMQQFMRQFIRQITTANAIHFHLRATTAGAVSVENCHLFRVWNTYISHNGVIARLARNPVLSDTHLFAKKLSENARFFNARTIIKAAKKYSAQGCFIFTSTDFERVAVMSIAKTSYLYYLPKISIVSNTPISISRYGYTINHAIELNNVLVEFANEDSMLIPKKKYNIVLRDPLPYYLCNGQINVPEIDREMLREYSKDSAWYVC